MDPAALPLTVDGETYEVTRPDGNDVAAVGSFAWAVEQANAHPGVDEIVIASGVVVEGHAGIFPLVESALVRGADATAGFKGTGVEAGGPDQYFEFRDLHLETGLPDEASLPIIELNGACGGQLTRVTAVGIQGIAMRADSVRILKIEDSVFEGNAAPDGFSYGGVVVVDYMSSDPLLTVTGTRFTGNAGGAIKVLKPLMFSESGSADIGVRIAGSTFEGNMGYDWDTQYGAGTVSLAGMTVVGGNAQPLFSVHDTTFAGNSAAYTGGILIGDLFDDSAASWDASVVSIQKSTFADNGVLVPDTGDVVGYDLVLGYMQPRAPLAPALSVNDSTFVNGNVEGDDVDGNGRVIASVAAPFVSGGVSLMHTTFIGSGLDLGYSFWGDRQVEVQNSVFDSGELDPLRADPNAAPAAPEVEMLERFNAFTTVPAVLGGTTASLVAPSEALALGPLDWTVGPTPVSIPQEGSVLIDAGGPGGLPTDQRGLARPQGNAPDVGSVEVLAALQPHPSVVAIGPDQETKSGGALEFTVSRTDAVENPRTGEASVTVATHDGSASAGTDYAALTETLIWAAGSTEAKTVRVATTKHDPAANEVRATVQLVLSAPGAHTVLGERTTAIGTIVTPKVPLIVDPVKPVEPDTKPGTHIATTGSDDSAMLWLVGGAAILAACGGLLLARSRASERARRQ